MGRPRIHDDETRQLLLRAAEAMVAHGGVEALSVRSLAAIVHTTTRAVYSVFGGKDGVIRKVLIGYGPGGEVELRKEVEAAMRG